MGGWELRGGDGGMGGGGGGMLFHTWYITLRELHIALLYYDVASLVLLVFYT